MKTEGKRGNRGSSLKIPIRFCSLKPQSFTRGEGKVVGQRKTTGVLISPYPDQEGNKLQRQKILMFIYPIYNHNWRNINIIYIYI
jgi:hypothetical protein